MPTADDTLIERLRSVLGVERIDALTRLSGGASRETWRCESQGEALVIQRQRAGSDRDMGLETAALRLAREAGVPVAQVVASGTHELGAPFMVVRAVNGETIARKIQRDERFAAARGALTGQLGAALAALHGIDPGRLAGLTGGDQLAQYRDVLDALGHPHPAFELAFRWLNDHRPPPSPPVIVHGDFRLGNVIVDEHGLAAVLDWELVHLGDPMEDLGWLCVRAWRFGGAQPVAGIGGYQELFEAYEAAGGGRVDPAVVRWWEVLGTLKWGIMCIMQSNAHLSGLTRSHELAAIGRRVCENEYDLFLALDGAW